MCEIKSVVNASGRHFHVLFRHKIHQLLLVTCVANRWLNGFTEVFEDVTRHHVKQVNSAAFAAIVNNWVGLQKYVITGHHFLRCKIVKAQCCIVSYTNPVGLKITTCILIFVQFLIAHEKEY